MKAASAVAFLVFLSTSAWADAGLDLAVLVDRSTSMAGDRRISTLLLPMTLDLVARNAAVNRVEHRLAVISFGSTAVIDVPFTRVRQRELPVLRRRLEMLRADDRGDTDVLAAFIAAEKLFRTLPSDPTRRRAIVLLTDGVPYVRGTDMAAYRSRMRQFLIDHLTPRQISLDVLLAGEPPRNRALWQSMAQRVHTTSRAVDAILAEAHGVITQLVGTKTTESAPSKTHATVDTLVIPPYLDVVVFDVFRGSPDAAIEIYAPGKTTPETGGVAGTEEVGVGDVLTTLIVPRPPPGEWTIRKSRRDARVRILSQQFFPRGTLVRPAPTDTPWQYDRLSLAYRVVDSSNRPVVELRDHALSVEVSVAKPNGSTSLMPMERAPAEGPSVFRSREDLESDVAGRYWTDVRITTTDTDGHRFEVFRDRWSGFSVVPATRVDCRVSTSETFPWLPVTAHVECAMEKRPLEMKAIANGSPSKLFRALLSRDGRSTQAELDLKYLGGGAFQGWLRGTSTRGAYQLQVAAIRSRLRAPYNIRFLPPRLIFVRRTAIESLVIPLGCAVAIGAVIVRRRKTRP